MRIARLATIIVLTLFTACGGDDGDGGSADAAAQIDSGGGDNPLGIICTAGANDCPDDGECVVLSSGSDTMGYCSPVCSNDTECTTGYAGPGTPTCFVPNQPNRCTISCTGTCPTGLECFVPPMAPSGFCRVPE